MQTGNASTKKPKAQKRILEVSIRRMLDDSPDTSWLGEYSDRPENEFAIDRAHTEDCASVNPQAIEAKEKLERITEHVKEWRNTECSDPDDTEWEALDASIDRLELLAEEVTECDCSGPGNDWNRSEYRYFNPGSVEKFKLEADWIPANITDPKERKAYWFDAMRKNTKQDYDRMEKLNNAYWGFIGIRADAELALPLAESYTLESRYGQKKIDYATQKITSGGLWGIESDSDKDYLTEIEQEQLSELKTQLLALGFSRRAIAKAFEDIKEVSE